MGFSLSGAWDSVTSAASNARHWVGDRLDDVDDAKNWVGGKIEGAVDSAEQAVDGFRQDIVQFGREHGGVVGEAAGQFVSNQLGVTEGAVLAVYDMGKGVVQLADGASKLVSPLEWATHADRNFQRVESIANTGVALGSLTSPVGWAVNSEGNMRTAGALWDGVTHGYQDAAANGDWSKFGGRLVVDVGSMFIGVGEANAAIKGGTTATRIAEGLNTADKIADGTRALDVLGDAGRLVRAGDSLPTSLIDDITKLPKGTRPAPSEYLSPAYIDQHMALFDDGASRFATQSAVDKYGIARADGTTFVMPKAEADALIASAGGDTAKLEEALGLPPGTLANDPLVRIDFPNPKEGNIRIPSGNEDGANTQWIPGGKLPTGSNEAVIDAGALPPSAYHMTTVN
ncbi:hypothetical protein FCE95_10220 [Luteimonas gilva]|uniref:Uncharacterized protein n=1 Tax=Luteimonas gilva TaxID=2572684 RepID=A0A4U5JLU1_9GAMM|nr:hypothetical protein [Luteimonas gilva]TKR30484.1 hypothetical protein FCE95_10220 [Luteimonas gilva]